MTRHHPHKQTPPLTPLRRVWLLFALTGLGCCVGVLALLYGAAAYVKAESAAPGAAHLAVLFPHPPGLVRLFGQLSALYHRGHGELFQDPPAV